MSRPNLFTAEPWRILSLEFFPHQSGGEATQVFSTPKAPLPPLLLVTGKGGVGKTAWARFLCREAQARGKRVLMAQIFPYGDETPSPSGPQPSEWGQAPYDQQALDPTACFREYIELKLQSKKLASLVTGTPFIHTLQRAAPGFRELVLLGKVWWESRRYDHVIVDMPSTGYALAMAKAPLNYSRIFPGGPIQKDAQAMAQTLNDPSQCRIFNISIPEEMPLQESKELHRELLDLFPLNPSWWVINRLQLLTADLPSLFEKDELALVRRLAVHLRNIEARQRIALKSHFSMNDSWHRTLPMITTVSEGAIK